MLKIRVIPCLQLIERSLVKTIKFKKYSYIGDPINTVRIFNELEVDELCFLDIRATVNNTPPNLQVLAEIADECFMPLAYGGGIRDIETGKQILSMGFEKLIVNSISYENPDFITQLSNRFGSQSVIASVDIKKDIWGNYKVYSHDGTNKTKYDIVEWALELEAKGAGELLLTSIERDGSWSGYDLEITRKVSDALSIPVIANGGAGNITHLEDAVKIGHADAVAMGSMVVYQKQGRGVLINFPDREDLKSFV